MLLRGGGDVLSAQSVARMMQDHITPEQKAASPFFPAFWDDKGWGYGGAVVTRGSEDGPLPGSYGWDGGFGTSFTADPTVRTVTILLLQRMMRAPDDTALAAALRRVAYAETSPATS
jgi:CubicO group peptidase (beta-lactamase class C family)